MSGILTFEDAVNALTNNPDEYVILDNIRELVKDITGEVSGANSDTVYFLNSGVLPNGTPSSTASLGMIQATDNAVGIGKSEVGKFVGSALIPGTALHRALRKAVVDDLFENQEFIVDDNGNFVFDSNSERKFALDPSNPHYNANKNLFRDRWYEFLYGQDYGTKARIHKDSLWDFASESYVQDALGDFKIISFGTPSELSVLTQREIPALIAKEGSFKVEGVDISFIRSLGDDAPEIIGKISQEKMLASGVVEFDADLDDYFHIPSKNSIYLDEGMDAYVNQQLIMTGVMDSGGQFDISKKSNYLEGDISDIQAYQVNNPDAVKRLHNYFDGLNDQGKQEFLVRQEKLKNIGSNFSSAGLSYDLNNLGKAADSFSFFYTGYQAGKLALSGDHEAASALMKSFAVDFIAGEAGARAGAIGGRAAAAVFTNIATGLFNIATSATPLGWAAKALVYGSSLIGGYLASDHADEFFDLFDDHDGNNHSDLVDKISNLLFGATDTFSGVTIPLDGGDLGFTADLTRDELVELAKEDIAYRYALREMNPFAFFGIDYEAVHNQDGSLD